MKQQPILFSTPMVVAILKGTKTETRRATGKIKTVNENPDNWNLNHFTSDKQGNLMAVFFNKEADTYLQVKSPYGFTGNLLWVREIWKLCGFTDECADEIRVQYKTGEKEQIDVYGDEDRFEFWNDKVEKLMYKLASKGKVEADEEREMTTWKAEDVPWSPSIHMPKDAARIWIKITNVTVERLLDITEESAKNEGVECIDDKIGCFKNYCDSNNLIGQYAAINSFSSLWQSINGAENLKQNPWVWVIQFEKITNPNL